MLKVLKDEFDTLFENGEYIDEKETEILEISFTYMRLLHMSPKPGKTLTKTDILLFLLIAYPVAISCATSYLLAQYSNRELLILDDVLQCLSIICSGLNMYITIAWFMYKNQEIANLAQNIGNFHQFRKPLGFDRANRFANFVSKAIALYAAAGVVVYTIICLFQRPNCLQENQELNIERICGLIAPVVLPDKWNYWPYFHVLLTAQIFNVMVICVAATIVMTFTCGLVVVMNSRIELCKQDMNAAFTITDDRIRKRRLAYCVRSHVYLLELEHQLNDCMSFPCFVQSAFMSGVIAIITFQFLIKPELKTAVHGVGWLLILAALSYGGQMLINESVDIPMNIYENDWFDFDVETQKFVLMIIGRGNYFLYIDTILFGPLALTTFGHVISNAYSLIAILHR